MRFKNARHYLLFASFAFYLLGYSHSVAQTYPVFEAGSNKYVVSLAEATGLVIDTLYIPDNSTLAFDSQVTRIDWTVKTIKFGKGSTIDLSSKRLFQPPPGSRLPDGGPPPPQADYCQPGAAGSPGIDGWPGADGKDLTLRNVEAFVGGDLWIKTDGDNGLNGGNGGDGQQGGGRRGLFPLGNRPCDAAAGGKGGRGGQGGSGGRPGKVTILFRFPQATQPTSQLAPNCGETVRPPELVNGVGVVAIYGATGCNGVAGKPGRDGLGG